MGILTHTRVSARIHNSRDADKNDCYSWGAGRARRVRRCRGALSMVVHGGAWWRMVVHDGAWWRMVVHGGAWWRTVAWQVDCQGGSVNFLSVSMLFGCAFTLPSSIL